MSSIPVFPILEFSYFTLSSKSDIRPLKENAGSQERDRAPPRAKIRFPRRVRFCLTSSKVGMGNQTKFIFGS
ncbi:hypothetical protein H6F74_26440 [Trichocoleus sp. FACHB-90]|uniref:hypothetical protein n=1 Tax=Cyanophyceae TaxID=3028117 RepID=UPI001682A0EA|nr:hypothetical protein [Trichocoleus sp. FACHB-90]MBD1929744.1 hypothetical protein [Trichocoleus sp. FACHB-90]